MSNSEYGLHDVFRIVDGCRDYIAMNRDYDTAQRIAECAAFYNETCPVYVECMRFADGGMEYLNRDGHSLKGAAW